MVDNPEERLVILKMPWDQRPFTRDGVVDALLWYGYHDFDGGGTFLKRPGIPGPLGEGSGC